MPRKGQGPHFARLLHLGHPQFAMILDQPCAKVLLRYFEKVDQPQTYKAQDEER